MLTENPCDKCQLCVRDTKPVSRQVTEFDDLYYDDIVEPLQKCSIFNSPVFVHNRQADDGIREEYVPCAYRVEGHPRRVYMASQNRRARMFANGFLDDAHEFVSIDQPVQPETSDEDEELVQAVMNITVTNDIFTMESFGASLHDVLYSSRRDIGELRCLGEIIAKMPDIKGAERLRALFEELEDVSEQQMALARARGNAFDTNNALGNVLLNAFRQRNQN